MSRRGARLSVAVLFALSIGAAAWQYWRVERSLGAHRAGTAAFERDARASALLLADLRASQQAYVAAGQGTDYWTARVAGSLASLKGRLATLRRESEAPEAATRLDAALASLDDFSRLDRRARDYAVTDQRLLASDLIFADGLQTSHAVALDLDGARAAELAYRDSRTAGFENQKRMLSGGVAGIGLLFMLILASTPANRRKRADEAPVPSAPQPEPTPAQADRPGLGLTPPPPPPGPVSAPVDLRLAASLCVDLARVTDTEQITSLLERAARVLDASGIVLWIADPEGRELVPTVAHGYPAAAIARVGPISRDADNATAAAFREVAVHIVKGDVLTDGAIAAPLVTPGGCAGVMAAEVRREREQSEEVRAVAAIVAAQLAALIGVTPAAAQPPQPQARAN
jgi:hypothetical protein